MSEENKIELALSWTKAQLGNTYSRVALADVNIIRAKREKRLVILPVLLRIRTTLKKIMQKMVILFGIFIVCVL